MRFVTHTHTHTSRLNDPVRQTEIEKCSIIIVRIFQRELCSNTQSEY